MLLLLLSGVSSCKTNSQTNPCLWAVEIRPKKADVLTDETVDTLLRYNLKRREFCK